MKAEELAKQIQKKGSFLCVGLDTDINRIPEHLKKEKDPVFAFNRAIIEATHEYTVAYKPNIAFYEALGSQGWDSLARTMEIIPKEILTLADAKRGDIGNTSRMYAKTFFETYDFDAVTVAPYMGEDSVSPFLAFEDKWVFLLALTSNPSSRDFQYHKEGERLLYEEVLLKGQAWAKDSPGNLGFVVGATQAESLEHIRSLAPESFLLIPGVGAQGGDLNAVCQHGKNSSGTGMLINSSRGIIYAGSGADFAQNAAQQAQSLQSSMKAYL